MIKQMGQKTERGKPMTTATLVEQIQSHLEMAGRSIADAQKHYHKAGLSLKKLKAQKKADGVKGSWAKYIHEHFGHSLSQQRADELIRIAEGKTTVVEVRAKAKAGMRKSRAKKSTKRYVDSQPEDPEHRRQNFLHHAAEAKRHALENGFDKTSDNEIDEEILGAARAAKAAWDYVNNQLSRRVSAENAGANENGARTRRITVETVDRVHIVPTPFSVKRESAAPVMQKSGPPPSKHVRERVPLIYPPVATTTERMSQKIG
jgi:hypothetical protein